MSAWRTARTPFPMAAYRLDAVQCALLRRCNNLEPTAEGAWSFHPADASKRRYPFVSQTYLRVAHGGHLERRDARSGSALSLGPPPVRLLNGGSAVARPDSVSFGENSSPDTPAQTIGRYALHTEIAS